MAATITTQLDYPLTDTHNNKVNEDILKQELENSTVSKDVLDIYCVGTTLRILFNGSLTSEDDSTVSNIVSAHTGDEFNVFPISKMGLAESSDDSGNQIEKLVLNTGRLPNGVYVLNFIMMVSCSSEGGGATGSLLVSKNGGSEIVRASEFSTHSQWQQLGGGVSLDAKAGDEYVFKLVFQRTGNAGNAARVRNASITFARL